jgi:hypothetical protein
LVLELFAAFTSPTFTKSFPASPRSISNLSELISETVVQIKSALSAERKASNLANSTGSGA